LTKVSLDRILLDSVVDDKCAWLGCIVMVQILLKDDPQLARVAISVVFFFFLSLSCDLTGETGRI
jgi:hypothetical protein